MEELNILEQLSRLNLNDKEEGTTCVYLSKLQRTKNRHYLTDNNGAFIYAQESKK